MKGNMSISNDRLNGYLSDEEIEAFSEKYKPVHYFSKNGSKTVKFYPMQHIGPEDFYDKRIEEIEKDIRDGHYILYEGIRVKKKKNGDPNKSLYGKLAEVLNLSIDKATIHITRNFQEYSKNSDIDFKEMGLLTRLTVLTFFNIVEKIVVPSMSLLPEEDIKETSRSFTLVSNDDSTQDMKIFCRFFTKDVIDKRNRRVVEDIFNTEKGKISVVYGMGHLAGIEKMLLDNGFYRKGK